MMRRLLSGLLVAVMVLPLTAGLSGCGSEGKAGNSSHYMLSPENTSVSTDTGITVSLGDYVLEEETGLVVTPRPAEEDAEAGYKIESYDFTLGDMTALDDFITIRIPYDDTYCEAGQDASCCVGAKYLNETTGCWEDVLFEVDKENKELVIYTDHLSVYGAFYVRNEGMRYAYISDVYAYLSQVDAKVAADVLAEYVAQGGAQGDLSVGLGASLVSELFGLSDNLSSGIDIATNPVNIASLGKPVFDTALADEAYKRLDKLGKIVAMVKIGSVILKDGASKSDMLGLYKDVASLALGFSESATIGTLMSGVWVFDYMLNAMFEQAMEIKMENIGMVYLHFNDYFNSGPYRARTLKDWRQVLIDIAERNPGDETAVKAAIEAEIDRYARVFWDIGPDVQAEVASDLDVNYKRMSYPTSAEIEPLVVDYKANLYERLYPVSASVRNYMEKKAQAEHVKALSTMRDFYNQIIDFKIVEEVASDKKPKYAGYVMRLEPLSDKAVKKNWTGTLKNDGSISSRFTMLGFIQAGSPDTVALYEPGSNPDKDEPKLRVGFTLKAPLTEVELGGTGRNLIYTEGSESKIVDWAMATALKQIGSIEVKPDGSFLASVAFAEDGRQGENKSNNIQVNNFELSGTFDASKGSGTATVSFKSVYFRKDISPLQAANPGDVKEYVTTYEYTDVATGNLTLSNNKGAVVMSGQLEHDRTGFTKLQHHEINKKVERWGENPTITDKSGRYGTKVSYNFTLSE